MWIVKTTPLFTRASQPLALELIAFALVQDTGLHPLLPSVQPV